MSQRCSSPDVNALDGICTERALDVAAGLVGTHQRNNQIQLRSGVDHPAGAAKNSIHFSKGPKTVDVYRRQNRTLCNQIFVDHEIPRVLFSSHGEQSTGGLQTQSDSTAGSLNYHNTFACGLCASQQHHTALCTIACKVFNIEHVNETDNLSLITNPDSVTPDAVLRSGVNVTAAATSAPSPQSAAAVTINSVSRPSRATGMLRDAANAGGEHEAVTAFPSEHERVCIELETGTSPGACGTERERVGAANSNPVHHPGFPPGPETAADVSASPLFSSPLTRQESSLVVQREGRLAERSPADSAGAAQAVTSRPCKAIDSRTNSDPGPRGFEFAEFPDFAFRKYARTFLVVASSEIVPMSSA